MRALHHYTCIDHGAGQIIRERVVRPSKITGLAWFTDLSEPAREALGLTQYVASCDRTAVRFTVASDLIVPWVEVRRDYDKTLRDALESAPGALPMHWWVSREEVAL